MNSRPFLKVFALVAAIVALPCQTPAVDYMYVTNGGQGPSFVSRFDTAGNYYGQITTNLDSPAGIAQDSARNVYVVNNGNNTVSIFDKDMTYVSSIDNTYLGGTAQVATIDKFDNLYVSMQSGDIVKYDSSHN